MKDLFRLKVVSKRQVTIPQRFMDLVGMQIGDEIQLRVARGRIVQASAVRITPNLEMSEDAQAAFTEIEKERRLSGAPDEDLSDLMDKYSDASDVFPRNIAPAQAYWARNYPGLAGGERVAPRNFHRSDERITELVAEGLAEAQLDVSDVDILTEKGQVTLRGTMNDKKGRLMAELVARNVLGVAEVYNEIGVPEPALAIETRGSEKSTQQR